MEPGPPTTHDDPTIRVRRPAQVEGLTTSLGARSSPRWAQSPGHSWRTARAAGVAL